MDLSKTGAFIAECRRKKHLTQKQLGEKLNVTDRAVSKWENARSFPDVSILENLCRELDISVSELLAGKRLEPEQYQEETDKLLMESLGKRQLYGFQIVIIILVLVMMVLIHLPFWMGYGSVGRPEIRPFFLFFWILAGAVAWCGCYINRKIPGKDLRHSSILIGGISAGLIFVANLMFGYFARNGMETPLLARLEESVGTPVILAFVICLGSVVLSGILSALRQRREMREWERYKGKGDRL